MALTPVEIRHIKLEPLALRVQPRRRRRAARRHRRELRAGVARTSGPRGQDRARRGGPRALSRARDSSAYDARIRRAGVSGSQGAGAARDAGHARRGTRRVAKGPAGGNEPTWSACAASHAASVRCSAPRSQRSKRTTARTKARPKRRRAKLRAMSVSAATTRLKLRVSPGARRPGIVGRHGDAWKVRVAEPPEDGRANEAVLRLLAKTLDVPRATVALVSGHSSRDKVVVLDGLEPAQTERLLAAAGTSA